jgi:hypothetical protein
MATQLARGFFVLLERDHMTSLQEVILHNVLDMQLRDALPDGSLGGSEGTVMH